MNESKAREAICQIGASIFRRGLTAGSSGNISVRIEDGWLMTPTNASLGRLDPGRLSKLDDGGRLLGGDAPTKESFLHRVMYEERAGTGAVIHLHSTHSVAISCLADVDQLGVDAGDVRRVRLVVVEHELHLPPEQSALLVDVLGPDLERKQPGLPDGSETAGLLDAEADLDRRLVVGTRRRRKPQQQHRRGGAKRVPNLSHVRHDCNSFTWAGVRKRVLAPRSNR